MSIELLTILIIPFFLKGSGCLGGDTSPSPAGTLPSEELPSLKKSTQELRQVKKEKSYRTFTLEYEDNKYEIKPDAQLRGAILRGADLTRADLKGANLQEAKLKGAKLQYADLKDANLTKANLIDADLVGAQLNPAKLQGANLWDAKLRKAKLYNADLSGAKLWGADLRGADLSGANLRGANLKLAKLQGADLTRAKLEGANLDLAKLQGADLQNITLDDNTNLWRAKYDDNTILGPVDPKKRWMIKKNKKKESYKPQCRESYTAYENPYTG